MAFGTEKLECMMLWLPNGEKKLKDMCNRFDRIPACDIQTDRQTNILRRHSRAVKSIYSRVDMVHECDRQRDG